MRKFYENNKQLIKGAILIIALFVILFSTNIIKFGWQNNTSDIKLKLLEDKVISLNKNLVKESAIRKFNSTKLKQFETSINYLDVQIRQKDKETLERLKQLEDTWRRVVATLTSHTKGD